jgi:S1-C subfamily serine protease
MKAFRPLFVVAITSISLILMLAGCFNTPKINYPLQSFIKIENYEMEEMDAGGLGIANAVVRTSSGSGSIIYHKKNRSYTLTAKHVCGGDSIVKRVLIDVDNETYQATIFAKSENHDICILESERINKPRIKLSLNPPKKGDNVYNVAAPGGAHERGYVPHFKGIYSGYSEKMKSDIYTIPAYPGCSGSPIVNRYGELVGLLFAVNGNFHHLSVSITHAQLFTFINSHLDMTEKLID